MRKIFNILGGISIVALSTISCTFAYTQEQQEAYQWAYKYGITTQSTIDAAKLNGKITRQAFTKMVVNYLENVVGVKQTTLNSCYFPDEGKITNDLKPYAKKTCAYGIMGSNGKNFNPTQPVNRAQLGTVLSRILWGDENNTNGKEYYVYHLNALKMNGIMNKIDNPQTDAKRGDVMIMLKRLYEKYGSDIYINGNKDVSYNNSATNTTNNNGKDLTQDEVQSLIEKEEGLKKGSLSSLGYECSSIGNQETCTYRFEYSIDGEKYIYSRNNKTSGKIEKIQDLGIRAAEDVALKDAKVPRNEAKIEQRSSTSEYNVAITTKDNVLFYTITLDGKIKKKKSLIAGDKALEIMLKEINLEHIQSDIEKENEEICSLSYGFIDDNHDTYQCSFTYGGKQYISYINAHDGTFIPIKKTASGISYGRSVTGKQNVIISKQFTYIDSDKAEELLTKKYNIKQGGFSWTRKIGEGENAIYSYTVDDSEYYINATDGTKMNSKDEIISSIAKDSGISKDIIRNSKKSLEDSDSVNDTIIEMSYMDTKTQEVVSIYSFNNQGTTYTYKVRNIDGKILDSKKESDIGENKAAELAKQTILKKYSVELEDEYANYNWSRAYIWYQSSAADDDIFKIPSEPEYVICFTDKAEENIYRIILKLDGNIISNDKMSIEEAGFLSTIYYFMGYSLDEIDELKDVSLEIGGGISM